MSHVLSRYAPGSLRELWALSWPAMLTSASSCLMIFGDRLVLSFYSQEAFNANVASLPWYWLMYFTFFGLTMVANTFVGQFNGERRYAEIGPVITQILWMCLCMWVVLIPLSIWVLPHLLAEKFKMLGLPYLRILTLFLPINCAAFVALSAFFVGRGCTRVVTVVTLFVNILNLILDVWFVFGGWFVPKMGIEGAAWATGLSQCVGLIIMATLYFAPKHREIYQTCKFEIVPSLWKRCLRVGYPSALGAALNCITWACMSQVLATHVSAAAFTAYGISHSIYVIFYFLLEGTEVGVHIVCANAIGAKKYDVVDKNLRSAFTLLALCCAIVFVGMVVYPKLLIRLFLPTDAAIEAYVITAKVLVFSWLLFLVEAAWMPSFSMLKAAGDTRYAMWVNVVFCWLGFLPVFTLVTYYGCGVITFYLIACIEYFGRASFLFYRYKSGHWRKLSI